VASGTAIVASRPWAADSIDPEQSRTNTTSCAPSSGTPKNSTTGAPTISTGSGGGGGGGGGAGGGAVTWTPTDTVVGTTTATLPRTAPPSAMVMPGGGRCTIGVHATVTSSGKTSDNGRMRRTPRTTARVGTMIRHGHRRDDATGASTSVTRLGRGAHPRATVAALAAIAATVPACVRQLPPAPTPQAVAPPIATPTPAAGQSALVVDVTDGPTPVSRVHMGTQPITDALGRVSYRLFEQPQEMCPASPCVVAMPPGNVMLGFPVIGDRDALEVELVHVDATPTVYRRTLSVYTDNTGALRKLGIVGASVGGTAALTGVVLLPIGLGKDLDGLTVAGGVTLGVGALLTAFGIWAIRRDAPTFRPGASIHF
jgi:hypothetical protein